MAWAFVRLSPACGVYFVPVTDPSKAVKVTRIDENSASKIIGIAPTAGHSENRIEIRTQFNSSGTSFLKSPRIITSAFTLEESYDTERKEDGLVQP